MGAVSSFKSQSQTEESIQCIRLRAISPGQKKNHLCIFLRIGKLVPKSHPIPVNISLNILFFKSKHLSLTIGEAHDECNPNISIDLVGRK